MKKPTISYFYLFYLLFFSTTVLAQPANNSFGSAALVPLNITCINGTNYLTNQVFFGATSDNATITGNACGAASANADVWYKFVAQTEFPVVTVTPTGSSWTTLLQVQILSGTVVTNLTEIGCGSNSASSGALVAITSNNALTRGTTYYVRVSKGSAGNPTGSNANWTFDICIREGTASRMGEVFTRTILSGAGVLQYPWEITYGPDDSLWVTESRGYKLYKMSPVSGVKRTVLDLTSGSTWLTTNGAPAGSDTLAAINISSWTTGGTPPGWPQGGFAGMALHPQFLDGTGLHDYVYVSYVHRYLSGAGSPNGVYFRNKLVRFKYNISTGKLGSPAVLCDTLPGSTDHNSQRMIIAPVTPGGTNYLFYANGDMGAGQFGNRYRTNNAQNPASYEGKILRFNIDTVGGLTWIPASNPSPASAVWCIGIRNNQGFAYDTALNLLYGASHGPYSDDEINIIQQSKNYGHPLVIGYAADGNYNGNAAPGTNTSISAGSPFNDATAPSPLLPAFSAPYGGKSACPPIGNELTNAATIGASYKDPVFSAYPTSNATITTTWQTNPGNGGWESEAWSGIDLYTNKMIPGWKKSLVAAGLKWGRLIRLKMGATGTTTLPSNIGGAVGNAGDTITYFQCTNRYRDLAFGPNGTDIYLVMDNSSATSGPGTANPVAPACAGCVIKYSFLGYLDAGGLSTIPKSVDVTDGPVNTCTAGNIITIDASNNFLWVPITGPDGNILAEINANGNNLGNVTSSFYKHSGAIRIKNGVHYLDRNITITPQVQPSTPVKVRLYISKAEFDALDADPSSGLTGTGAINLLKVLKNNDPCGSVLVNGAGSSLLVPTNTLIPDLTQGTSGYDLQISIPSFSSFYFATGMGTLPLDLITFTGSLQTNNTVLLKWKTENERNSSHFVIERSIDGNNFNNIGSVGAAGFSSSALDYRFNDMDAANQQSMILYYRLKIFDRDGNFKYSNIVIISLADITGGVSISPNPATGKVDLNINAKMDGMITWKLFDNTGHIMMQNSGFVRKGPGNNFSINISRLSAGSYYMSVSGVELNQQIKLEKL